ncbi:tetratricopeptide repeat protein [Candidatus Poribacteria bacterium]|nr:tetratricopeptide repeat protein [Candidatus Poribacteria bacterium]
MKETIIGVLAGAALVILSWLPGAVAKPDIGELYKDAENAYEDKDPEDELEERYYLKAIDRYKAALIKSEQKILEINGNINFLKNNAEMASGKKAIDEYKKVLEASQKGSITEIEKLCMEAEIASGRNYSKIELLYKVAGLRQESKEYQKAIDEYKIVLRKNPKGELIFFNDYKKAINKYKEALDKSQKDVPKDPDKMTEVNKKFEALRAEADKVYDDEKIKSLLDKAKNESETAYQQEDYHGAIDKYKKALKEIQKDAAEAIDKYKEVLRLSQESRKTEIEKKREEAETEEKIASETQEYHRAISKYKEALTESLKNTAKLHKNFNVLVQYKIALCYANLAYKVADIENLRKEGDEKYDAGDYSTSAQKYEKALEKSQKEIAENDGEIKKLREGAETAYNEKKYQEAFDNYLKVIEKSKWGVNTETQKEAKRLVKGKKYQEAADKYKAALIESPNWNSDDFYSLALEQIKEIDTGDRDNALDDYREGLAYLEAHIKFIKERDNTKLKEFIKKFPYSQFRPDALYATGDIITLLEEFPDFPLSNEARFRRAKQYFENGEFPLAYQDYKAFLDNSPEEASKAEEARYRSLYCRWQLMLQGTPINGENLDTLLNDYRDFAHNTGNQNFFAAAYFDMGNIYLRERQFEEARQHFDLALQNTVGNDEMYKGMALRAKLGIAASSFELRDWRGVVDTLEDIKAQIQTETPEFIGYYNNLLAEAYYQLDDWSHGTSDSLETEAWRLSKEADTHFDKGEDPQAAAKYNDVWNKAPMKPDFYKLKFRAKYREGLCYFRTNEFNKAVGAYNIALGFAEGAAQGFIEQQYIDSCRLNLALTYEKLNNWTDARKSYNEILKNSPSKYYQDAQLLLAQSYTQENPQKAIEEYEKASGDAARINRANLLYKTENYAEAAALYEEIAKEVPRSKHANEAQYMAGLCYYEIKDKPEDLNKAIGIFDKVVENPDSPYALDAYYGKILANKDLAEKYQSLWEKEKDPDKKKELAAIGLSQWAKTEKVALAVLSKFTDSADARKTSIDTIRKYATGIKYKMEGIPKLDKDQQDIIESNPDPTAKAKAQLKRADFYFKDPQFGDPLTVYQDLVNMAPGDEYIKIAKYQIVAHYYRSNNYAECVNAAVDAIKYNPDEEMLVRIYYMRGKSNYRLGNSEGAAADFMIVSQMDSVTDLSRKPLIIDANEILAGIGGDKESIKKSIKAYEYIITHTGDIASQDILKKVNAYYQIGLLYEKLKDIDEEQRDIDNAIQAFDNLRNYYEAQKEKFRPGIMDRPEIENVIDKVIDAGLRRASLISRRNLDTAITDAENVRNEAVFSKDTAPYTTPLRKIHAQYQVGYLYYQRMVKAKENRESEGNVDLYGGRANAAFQEALRIQKPPLEALPYVRDSAFLMGEIAAARPGQAENARNFLNRFITRANNGEFGTDEKVKELLPKALFSLSKVEHRLGNYDESIRLLNDLISRPDGQNNPLYHFQLGEAYFGKQDYPRAKSEYERALGLAPQPNPTDEASYGIGDDALYGIIVSVDQMWRQADNEDRQNALGEQKKELNERMTTNYPKSDFAPLAYINLGVIDFNNGVDASDVNIKINYFKKALENYQIAYKHPKIKNEDQKRTKTDLKDTLKELIKTNIEESRRLRNVPDEAGALSYNENVIAFCDQLIDIFPGDAAIAIEVGSYIQQIEAEIAEIKPILYNDPRIPKVNNEIARVRRRIKP